MYPLVPSVDLTPPTVAIISPANDGNVAKGSSVTIVAAASDDVRVAKVDFYAKS